MNIDTNDTGERLGAPGVCAYCKRPIETEHAEDCVIPQRTVVLDLRVRYVASVPRGWTQDEILFHRNDGSFCLNNDLDRIGEETAADGAACLCSRAEVAFVREATAEDHRFFGWQGEKA